MKTVRELSDEHGIDRSTLLKAVQQDRIPGRKSGATWLIDDSTEAFKTWLVSRKRIGGKDAALRLRRLH